MGGGYTLSRAFTLIELLVVIAIIGILATVVIASLNSARTKGRHAAIKSNLRNAVSQAAIYFSENGTYTGLCSDPKIQEIVAALGGSGSASCYAASDALGNTDFGIAAVYSGNYFIAGPQGVLRYDRALATASLSWNDDTANCAALGLQLGNGSGLRALQQIAPNSIATGYIWSATDSPGGPSSAVRVNMADGAVNTLGKTVTGGTGAARCFGS